MATPIPAARPSRSPASHIETHALRLAGMQSFVFERECLLLGRDGTSAGCNPAVSSRPTCYALAPSACKRQTSTSTTRAFKRGAAKSRKARSFSGRMPCPV